MSDKSRPKPGTVWAPNGANKKRLFARLTKRDGRCCWLCGLPMVMQGGGNHPRAVSLDHVIPRSHGGSNELSNLRLACRECNTQRGDRTIDAS